MLVIRNLIKAGTAVNAAVPNILYLCNLLFSLQTAFYPCHFLQM